MRVVEAHNDELVAMLRTNQIEFAVGALAEPAPDLSFTPLAEDCFCAIYPEGHRLDRKRGPLHWRDVLRYDLILLSQGSNARQQFDRAVREETGAPATALRYDVTNMGTAAGMVRQGLGVSVLPRLALPELNLAGLRAAPLCDASARRAIGLLHRRDRSLSPAAQALAAQLATAMDEIVRRLLPLPPVK
ncbi:LysR substrate-binding domain-containing protein [Achromobacter xylosoxidans]